MKKGKDIIELIIKVNSNKNYKMKKYIFLIVATCGLVLSSQAQIGYGTNNPDPRAVIELNSSDKAFYLPRLTTTQLNAQTGWKEGMMVYNTDSNCVYFRGDTDWECVGTGSAGGGGTDDQKIDTLTLSGDDLQISLEGDGEAAQTVDLSGFKDGDAWGVTGEDQTGEISRSGKTIQKGTYGPWDGGFEVMHSNGTQGILFGYSGISKGGTATNSNFFLDSKGTGHIVLNNTATGNIGIGTNSPQVKLHVAGGARITTMATGISSDSVVVVDGSGNLKKVAQSSISSSSADDQKIDTLTLSGDDLQISLEGDGEAAQTVDLSGFKDGDAWGVTGENQTGNISRTGSVGIGGAAYNGNKFTIHGVNSMQDGGIIIRHGNGTQALLLGSRGITNGGTATNGDIYFDAKGSGRLFLQTNSSGLVGIGTTSPSAKLHVAGDARITSMSDGSSSDSVVVVDSNGLLKKVAQSSISSADDQKIDTLTLQGDTLLQISLEGDGEGVQTVDLSSLVKEPWFGDDDDAAATSNTEDIYHMGSIGIGISSPTQKMDINGKLKIRDVPIGQIEDHILSLDTAGNVFKIEMMTLRRGDDVNKGAGNDQLFFSYKSGLQLNHGIRTRHNRDNTGTDGNAIEFYTWQKGVDSNDGEPTEFGFGINNGKVAIGRGTNFDPQATIHAVADNGQRLTATSVGDLAEMIRLDHLGTSSTKSGARCKISLGTMEASANPLSRLDFDLLHSGTTYRKFSMNADGEFSINGLPYNNNKLTISNVNSIQDGGIIIRHGNGTQALLLGSRGITNGGTATNGNIYLDGKGTGHVLLQTTATGRVGIGTTAPTQKLHVSGNILATGTITPNSDQRLKDKISIVENGLSKVLKMRGVHWNWKNPKNHGNNTGRVSGVIAQELQQLAPELIFQQKDEIGTLSVNYNGLSAYFIEAIKEQQEQLDKKDKEIKTLKSTLDQLLKRVEKLELK